MGMHSHSPTREGRARGPSARRAFSFVTALVLLAGLLPVLATTPAFATHPGEDSGNGITPIWEDDNPTCADLSSDPNVQEFKIEPVTSGTKTQVSSGLIIELNVYSVTSPIEGPVFDWSSNFPIDSVFVKGGDNGNHYIYFPPTSESADTLLHSPVNHSNGKYFGLSHVSFCWSPRPSTDLTLDSANPSNLIIHSGDSITLVFAEENDGNVPLTNPTVSADEGCVPASVDDDSDGFNDGDTNKNGVLDPGETWLFSCTVTLTSTTTITAIGSGADPQGNNVTWCSDPNNPPADTICDQDEIAQVTVTVINPSTNLTLSGQTSPITVTKGDNVTLTFAEENDGDAALTSPSVTTDHSGCATPAFVSGDTNSNGVLDPGETWLFECTLTNLQSSVTVTALGFGTDPTGTVVTWCSDPGNPPANTLCDQDEITVVQIDVLGFPGCTPGYWKQSHHFASWGPTGYAPSDLLGSVFASTNPYNNNTLVQALDFGGGGGVNGAKQILLRAAVAALLNAAHPDIAYPMTAAQVIADVNAALATGNRGTILALATQLDDLNNDGDCPLN